MLWDGPTSLDSTVAHMAHLFLTRLISRIGIFAYYYWSYDRGFHSKIQVVVVVYNGEFSWGSLEFRFFTLGSFMVLCWCNKSSRDSSVMHQSVVVVVEWTEILAKDYFALKKKKFLFRWKCFGWFEPMFPRGIFSTQWNVLVFHFDQLQVIPSAQRDRRLWASKKIENPLLLIHTSSIVYLTKLNDYIKLLVRSF